MMSLTFSHLGINFNFSSSYPKAEILWKSSNFTISYLCVLHYSWWLVYRRTIHTIPWLQHLTIAPNSSKITNYNILLQYVINQQSIQICNSVLKLECDYHELPTCLLRQEAGLCPNISSIWWKYQLIIEGHFVFCRNNIVINLSCMLMISGIR